MRVEGGGLGVGGSGLEILGRGSRVDCSVLSVEC
jgi:hypothetical protein